MKDTNSEMMDDLRPEYDLESLRVRKLGAGRKSFLRSPEQQNAITSRSLAELQEDQKWEIRFAETTDDQWDKMAAMVRQEIANSETVPFD